MKTQVVLLLIVAASILCACKKNDPAPAVSTPPVNQSSTTAPSLVSGTNTSLIAHTGTSNTGLVNLSDVVIDPQGDAWSITSVTSSNTSVATIEAVSEGAAYGFRYAGLTTGTAIFTIVATDVNGNANTFTYSIRVSHPPVIINQPSTTAPSLASGTNTSLSVSTGSSNSGILNLSTVVSDPQGDAWSIESVSSSDITILGVAITSGNNQALEYTGNGNGNATITIVVKDVNNNTNTLTYTVSVTTPPVAANAGPALNTGVNTSFSIQDGSNAGWDLSDKVTDAEGDTWTITTISTSNASIATATIQSGSKSIDYVARGVGNATLTLTLTDARNATSTVTVTINVYPKIGGPK